jgi:structural maintenance of chromosome 1
MSQAVADLKREFRGQVFGRLPDVCSVKAKKYNNAIAVLSGRHMDSVVVTTLEVAKDCMNFLKEKQLEPMEFIPLDNVTVRPQPLHRTTPRISLPW